MAATRVSNSMFMFRQSRAARIPQCCFFFGGSWNSGVRVDYRFMGEALVSCGVLVVIADYRLFP
jgi:carboxylesterase type B